MYVFVVSCTVLLQLNIHYFSIKKHPLFKRQQLMLVENGYYQNNDGFNTTQIVIKPNVTTFVSSVSESTNVLATSLPNKSDTITVYTNAPFNRMNHTFNTTTKRDKDRAELDLLSPELSYSVNQTENLFNVQEVLQRNKTRRIGHMDYYLRDEPIPKKTMENPALVIIGCSRMNSIVRILEEITLIPGIDDYSLYLSLGCVEKISATRMHSHLERKLYSFLDRLTILEYKDDMVNVSDIKQMYLRIHNHYNFIFYQLFEVYHHSHVFFVEDDLTLSPTSFDFINQVVGLLDYDPSLICVSLFNDNGLAESYNPVALHRSSLFPNLALLFNRNGYERIWKGVTFSYSTSGWDHWLRSKAKELGYECVYPSLPRVYHHVYEVGTTTNKKMNNRISRIPFYKDMVNVDLGDLTYLLSSYYDVSLLAKLVPFHLIPSVYENMQIPLKNIIEGKKANSTVNALFSWEEYRDGNNPHIAVTSYKEERQFMRIKRANQHTQVNIVVASEYYTSYAIRCLLSRSPRGFHKGILFFELNDMRVFMIDKREAWYALPAEETLIFVSDNKILLSKNDESCTEVCSHYSSTIQKKYVCNQNQLQFINSCYYLNKYFPCERGCWNEVGQDLPAYVNSTGDPSDQYCLFSSEVQPLCDFALEKTQRLCLCVNVEKLPVGRREMRTAMLKETKRALNNRRKRKH